MRAMKSNPTTNDLQEAKARVERARGNRANAGKRLTRAQAAAEVAVKEVADAEKELTSASAHLEQAVRKTLSAAMKAGGTDMSLALAEIISKSMSGDDDGQDSGKTAEPPATGQKTAPDANDANAMLPLEPASPPSSTNGDVASATASDLSDATA